jgi:hypothetical protein
MSRSAIPPLLTAFSTGWSIMPTESNSTADRCAKNEAGNRTKDLSERASTVLMWGKETQTPFPCPTPPSRLKTIQALTDVNNFRHHCKCQRRFAPIYSHPVGTAHSHRRNPQTLRHKALLMPAELIRTHNRPALALSASGNQEAAWKHALQRINKLKL